MEQATCKRCDQRFHPANGHQAYCTKSCQKKGEKERARARGYRAPKVELVCAWCERTYLGALPTPKRAGWSTYCGPGCMAAGMSWARSAEKRCDLPWRDCQDCGIRFYEKHNPTRCLRCRTQDKPGRWIAGPCAECGEPFVGRWHPLWPSRFCSDRCINRVARRRSRAKHGRIDEARKRARHFGVPYEPISRAKVFERDGYRCQLCGQMTKRNAQVPDPRAPTVDHIIPMSVGGGHLYINVQCACFECNWKKGDGAANDQLRLVA